MSVDIFCPHLTFQVVLRNPKKKSKLASPQKDLRERVIAALFATLQEQRVPLLSFNEVIVPSVVSEESEPQNTSSSISSTEMELEDPNPFGVDSTPSAEISASQEYSYDDEDEIDDDFVYYGSRACDEDDYDYEDAFWNACHDMADEYEEKMFKGRKNSRKNLNQTLRAKQVDKHEKVNPKRRVKACEVAKKEAKESNIAFYNDIRKQKALRKNCALIPVPPWIPSDSPASFVPASRGNAVLNPASRIEEERQLAMAIQQSRQSVHASGLTMQQILELTTRDLTPEDYEMLLQLDSLVEKKTLSKNDLSRFKQSTVAQTSPDEPCVICFSNFCKGEKQTELPCTHKYHSACIETWLTQSGTTCPLCGVSLD